MRRTFLIALSLLLCALPCLAQAEHGVTLSFGTNSVTAAGITPGKSAVLFASGLAADDAQQRVVRWVRILSDDDRDGRVTLTLAERVPAATIWAAVDLANGQYAVASPNGSMPRVTKLPPGAFRRSNGSSAVDQFGFDHPVLELLYVHPGLGAWTWTALDGRMLDRDGPNGVTLISVADAKPVGDTAGKPAGFAPGGVLVAVDWYDMEALILRLDGGLLGGAP
jgi:hypothetical protein